MRALPLVRAIVIAFILIVLFLIIFFALKKLKPKNQNKASYSSQNTTIYSLPTPTTALPKINSNIKSGGCLIVEEKNCKSFTMANSSLSFGPVAEFNVPAKTPIFAPADGELDNLVTRLERNGVVTVYPELGIRTPNKPPDFYSYVGYIDDVYPINTTPMVKKGTLIGYFTGKNLDDRTSFIFRTYSNVGVGVDDKNPIVPTPYDTTAKKTFLNTYSK